MRHYLNTTLKGKKDSRGLDHYSVYIMFSVQRQTFKIKSRIFNKRITKDKFNRLNSSKNQYIAKDEKIIQDCIEASSLNGLLDIDQFKNLYTKKCTSIKSWLSNEIIQEQKRLNDDFFYGSEIDDDMDEPSVVKELEHLYGINKRTALHYLEHYSMNHNDSFDKYLLVHDWQSESLRDRFILFLRNSGGIPDEHEKLVLFIDSLTLII
ncbi:MAG: hypothetical protein COA33_000685 [Fluviicola sp.]|nr:hypothetical protein [Fluviicola sp.]